MPQNNNKLQERLYDVEEKLTALLASNNKLKDNYAVLTSNYDNLVNDLNRRLEDLNSRVNTFQK
jgi:chaperonin cofactor prefoldin